MLRVVHKYIHCLLSFPKGLSPRGFSKIIQKVKVVFIIIELNDRNKNSMQNVVTPLLILPLQHRTISFTQSV